MQCITYVQFAASPIVPASESSGSTNKNPPQKLHHTYHAEGQ
jgi:hypothetical protein